MSIQGNSVGCRLDIDIDLYDPLEAKGTTEFKIKELDSIIDRFDTDFINESLQQWRLGHTCQARRFGLRQPWW